MEAVLDVTAVGQDQIAQWLSETASPQESVVHEATLHLEAAESVPKFALFLLMLSAGGQEKGQRIAAATYLKNYLKGHWTDSGTMSAGERLGFRNQLVEVLLLVDGLVLKLLAEAFRLVAASDFAKQMTWPELVPAFKTAIQNSDLVNGTGTSELKTMNVLIGVQTIIKPFQYFMDPTVAREPVPEQLELISKELLAPLHGIFHHLVQQVAASKDQGHAQHDDILLVLCKCYYLAMKSHMPASLLACLGPWFQDLIVLLEMIVLEKKMDSPEQEPRLKIWKRVLQICSNLAARHRKYVDKYLPPMATVALMIVERSTIAKDLHPMQDRIVSLSFDLVSNILETGPGWRLMAPEFKCMLESAIFPALIMKEKDIMEWEEDEDEYMRKNLPSDLDEASGWKEDLLTPRQSALNLLGLIATSKGPPVARETKNLATMKRKKGGKGNVRDEEGTAGDVLVMPFLSQFPVPPDGVQPTSETVANYFGVMMAYGGVHEFLKTQDAEILTNFLQTRVFPLYAMVLPSPYVLANSNWLLGELAACLPEELNEVLYSALLKSLLAPDVGGVSWRLVRQSAAGALTSLLQEDYKPAHWLPLLQATVAGARMQEQGEAAISFQLLATAAEVGEDEVAHHVPAISEAVVKEISQHIPPHPEPWPQVVECGIAALASLAQTWDTAEPDEDKDNGKALNNWKAGSVTLANTFSVLLQWAWLTPSQEEASAQPTPPPSCLSDASVLLATILRYTPDQSTSTIMKAELLLEVWAHLIADWKAWEEEEDESAFDAIEEAVALQGRSPMPHFTGAEGLMPLSTSTSSCSILEDLVVFVTGAIESAYPAACWRACRCSHALLHASAGSFEGEEIAKMLVPQFCEVAARRLQQLTSVSVPLAKPLILVISMCFILLPEDVEKILSAGDEIMYPNEEGNCQALLKWADALAGLAESDADPGLSLESEMKLAAMALQKIFEYILQNDKVCSPKGIKTVHHCFQSMLEVMVDLKELQEYEEAESGDDEEEEDDEEEDEVDDSDEASESEDSEVEHEETEDEFLERSAQTARELQEEAVVDAENGQDEDGHEIELGVLGLVDQDAAVLACLKAHGERLLSERPLPKELVTRFEHKFPACKTYLLQNVQ